MKQQNQFWLTDDLPVKKIELITKGFENEKQFDQASFYTKESQMRKLFDYSWKTVKNVTRSPRSACHLNYQSWIFFHHDRIL